MNRTKIIEHYKKFHGVGELSEDCQINIDWAESLLKDLCNGTTLHEKRKCHNCGTLFSPTNHHQKCCNDTCRVQLHRAKKRFKDFNNKVQEIINQKNPDIGFIVEQIITNSNKCPFVVYLNGSKYESESTKSLISKIRKACNH